MSAKKSFAQHLQEIEQEAARAASRVRLAHSKVHSALDESVTPPTPLTAWPENTPAVTPSTGAAQLASMQREQVRMAWDLSVLKRAMPELEAAATMSGRMAEGFRSQQESYAKGRVAGDLALEEMRTLLQQSREEANSLRARNADLEREISALRHASAGAELAPRTPHTGRSGSMAGALSPLSPLLVGLDETDPTRSRGSAYWRRARMCLKIASIADYWSKQSARSASGGGPGYMGTPMPGRMPGGDGVGALPMGAAVTADGSPVPPRLAAISRKVDVAVGEAVARSLLDVALVDSAPEDPAGGSSPAKRKRASEAEKAKAAAAAATAAAERVVAAASQETLAAAERAALQPRLEALLAAAASGAAFADAMAHMPASVGAIASAVAVVIDQNMPPLTAHLHTIIKDGVAAAVRQLQARATTGGARADEEAARAKTTAVMTTLHAAVDNVRQQFVVGLRSSIPPAVAEALGKPLLDALCEAAVSSRCEKLRALADATEITARIWEEVAIVQDFVAGVSKAGPQPWLLSLLLQEVKVALPEALESYIASHIANHLDPYIDGEVTSPEEERGTSPMYALICKAYEREHGRELPAPAEVVLALYVRHGICKSNVRAARAAPHPSHACAPLSLSLSAPHPRLCALTRCTCAAICFSPVCVAQAYQCFTDLVMGQGRLPIMGDPQMTHCRALGVALEKAIEKDFGKQHAKIQGVPISAQLVEELAKQHSDRLFFDHQKNAERLAEANRVGELGRKEEMKRIFGIEI
jgi:hypothetical protein